MPDSGSSTTRTISAEETADGTLDGRARAAYRTQERRERGDVERRLDGVIRRARQLIADRLCGTPLGHDLPEHVAAAPVEVIDDPAGVHRHIVRMTLEDHTFHVDAHHVYLAEPCPTCGGQRRVGIDGLTGLGRVLAHADGSAPEGSSPPAWRCPACAERERNIRVTVPDPPRSTEELLRLAQSAAHDAILGKDAARNALVSIACSLQALVRRSRIGR